MRDVCTSTMITCKQYAAKFEDFQNMKFTELSQSAFTFMNIYILLVIRFMADLLQKYRGSVVIMVGRGGAEPHYVHN